MLIHLPAPGRHRRRSDQTGRGPEASETASLKEIKYDLTPEVFAAFDAGDEYALRRALNLDPWHARARLNLAGPPSYGPDLLWAQVSPGRIRETTTAMAILEGARHVGKADRGL